jgi:hypothetical protein
MSQLDAGRAFFTAFSALGKTYVSYPNGKKLNTPSDPIPVETLWYVLDVMYGKPNVIASGQPNLRHNGIFQVTIKSPVVDSLGNPYGTYAVGIDADSIAASFKLGTDLPYPATNPTKHVRCEEPQIVILGNQEPEWFTVIVRIPFRMDD